MVLIYFDVHLKLSTRLLFSYGSKTRVSVWIVQTVGACDFLPKLRAGRSPQRANEYYWITGC